MEDHEAECDAEGAVHERTVRVKTFTRYTFRSPKIDHPTSAPHIFVYVGKIECIPLFVIFGFCSIPFPSIPFPGIFFAENNMYDVRFLR